LGKARTPASRFVKRKTKPAPTLRSETADKILDVAERLIQTRGCSAFSYQDIADALKIRKASIHYHFESKTDLVTAVVNRYTEKFDAALKIIARDETATSMSMLEHYVEPYTAFAATPDRVCLCGALSGEMLALPPELRERVARFFKSHQQWLTRRVQAGGDARKDCPACLRRTAGRSSGPAHDRGFLAIEGCDFGDEGAAAGVAVSGFRVTTSPQNYPPRAFRPPCRRRW
jgi:TetR/AcrR family transcriptional repressor of nem operon